MDEVTARPDNPATFHVRHSLLMLAFGFSILLGLCYLLVQNGRLQQETELQRRQNWFQNRVRSIDRQALTLQSRGEVDPSITELFFSLRQESEAAAGTLLLFSNEGRLAPSSAAKDSNSTASELLELISGSPKITAARLEALPAGQPVRLGAWSVLREPLQNAPWQAVLVLPRPSPASAFATSLSGITSLVGLTLFSTLCALLLLNHQRMVRPSARLLQLLDSLDRSRTPVPYQQRPPSAWNPWFHRVETIFQRHRTLAEKQKSELENLDLLLKQRTMELEHLNQAFQEEIEERSRAEGALRRVNQEVRELSLVDGLTGIPNYRKFKEYLHLYWSQMARERSPVSIIACNVDYLKKYNAAYGHQAGDRCLRDIAQVIKAALHRPNDLVARCGSEKFFILLPGTDLAGAHRVAAGVRQALRALRTTHGGDLDARIRFSFGMAGRIPTLEDSAEALLEAATQSLRQAEQAQDSTIINLPDKD